MRIKIRIATQKDHNAICKVARQSKYTKDFSNIIFSGEACYAEGKIWVAERVGREIVGFTCVRDRKRSPLTILYFIGVDKEHQNQGIGKMLMSNLWEQSPMPAVQFNVMNDNPAISFYRKLGYRKVDDAYKGEGIVMQGKREKCAGGAHKKTPW